MPDFRPGVARRPAAAQPASMPGADKSQTNIQDTFLNAVRKERLTVTLAMNNGEKLSGRIKSFDKYSLILATNAEEQLVFKHAIAMVSVVRSEPAAVPEQG